MSRPDQCPMCRSLNYTPLNADGSRYNPFLDRQEQLFLHHNALWELCRCDECGHVWQFKIWKEMHCESMA